MDNTIQTILSTRRAHQSAGELNFAAALHAKLKSLNYTPEAKALGNIVVTVPPKKGKLKVNVMFSCHIDTCHSPTESNGVAQKLAYDSVKGHIFLADPDSSGCLGADDGAGIYIMVKMIEAAVPGTYVFHRGEERGCLGSREMVAKEVAWLKTFDACIAFDRPNINEVIATQSGQACASVAYAKALADALNAAESTFKYAVSHNGSVTDSKMYAPYISECINLGVGYFHQHSNSEYLDWNHLQKLAAAVTKLDWQALVPSREPVPAQKPVYRGHYASAGSSLGQGLYGEDDLFPAGEPSTKQPASVLKPVPKPEPVLSLSFQAEVENADTYIELEELLSEECALVVIALRAELAAANARAITLATHFGVDVTW